ncbi:MAG: FAD-dependent oxidoreductase [Candidatus Omnitrophota bacterium]|jgi:thioredoxin reductase (NADPH)
MKKNTSLAIIGSGIAGVSAAVYAKRAGLDFTLFEPGPVGGQLLLMESVDNYAGVKVGTKGYELAKTLSDALSELDIEITREEIIKFEAFGKEIVIHSQENNFSFQSAIIATGASFKKLKIEGEERLTGKGVSYCAICDGFFFRNKTVAVVGGGNSAVEEALYLSNICSKVYLIHRRGELRAIDYLQKELFNKKNVEVIFNASIKEFKGNDLLEAITIKNINTNEDKSIPLNGLFIAIGVKPNTEFLKNAISLDNLGFVLTDQEMKTNHDFIFAVGDCRKRPLRQLVTAAAEGSIAALSAYKYLKGGYVSA